jgi:hypothetical protein
MKKPLTAFVLMVFVINAAPATPTLELDCLTAAGTCAANQPFTFTGSNYNPHKTYLIEGMSFQNPADTFIHQVTPDPNGNISDVDFLPAGEWTFTVYVASSKGTPQKSVACLDVVFE